MTADFDVIIVGSGPAGVSAAFPLLTAGLRVLMVDGGKKSLQAPPAEDFLEWRSTDTTQKKWLVGRDFHALKMREAVSPKLRVPSLAYAFNQFSEKNQVGSKDFIAIGSLATGGLSNAWGCGVAAYSAEELAAFPCPPTEMHHSYGVVARRMGISGGEADDLSGYFGLDAWSSPAIELDASHTYLHSRYSRAKATLNHAGFRLGKSRVAVLTEEREGREACTRSGNCMWGCDRKALYSASDELIALRRFPNFRHLPGFVVTRVISDGTRSSIVGTVDGDVVIQRITASKVFLAAGTLATTRLAMQLANIDHPLRMLSCPTAAFLLWLPALLGSSRTAGFGLGQLSFNLTLGNGTSGFGSTFSPTGIPVAEFARHIPLGRRFGIDLLQNLLSSCLVGNIFLPGSLSDAQVRLTSNGSLEVSGSYNGELSVLMKEAARKLRQAYQRLGAVLLPMSFTVGQPGGDIHYAGTLPMKAVPGIGETNALGQLRGFEGVFIVDGACLPILPEKSHTLTIMANANRIAEQVAKT